MCFFRRCEYAQGNFEYLSTTSSKYLFPASDVFGKFCKSTSSTSHCSRNLAGSIANCGYATNSCAYTHTIERTPARLYTCPTSAIGPATTLTFSRPRDARVGGVLERVGPIVGSSGWQVPTSVLPV